MKPRKRRNWSPPPRGGNEIFEMRDAGPPEINEAAWEAARREAKEQANETLAPPRPGGEARTASAPAGDIDFREVALQVLSAMGVANAESVAAEIARAIREEEIRRMGGGTEAGSDKSSGPSHAA